MACELTAVVAVDILVQVGVRVNEYAVQLSLTLTRFDDRSDLQEQPQQQQSSVLVSTGS